MTRFCMALAIALVAVRASADFTGPYAPGAWTLLDEALGSGMLTETTMTIVGGDAGVAGRVEYYVTVPETTWLEFHWKYAYLGKPGYDWCYYAVDDVAVALADGMEWELEGGILTLLKAGQKLSLGVYTYDGLDGPGILTVTQFVPEPAALSLLALGALAMFCRRKV